MEDQFCQWGEHLVEDVSMIKSSVGTKGKRRYYWVCKECLEEIKRLEKHLKEEKRRIDGKPKSQLFFNGESYYQKMLDKIKKPSFEDRWSILMGRRKP